MTLPALLFTTGNVRLALGTNKGQSGFGAIAALTTYFRAGHVDRDRLAPSFLSAFAGSLGGVALVFALDPTKLRPIVLALLVAVAIFFTVRGARRGTSLGWAFAKTNPAIPAAVIGLVLGAYDGFFGPGTGAFLIALYVAIFGDDLTRATANAKVANFASNLGGFIAFAWLGAIDFKLALPMAAAQIAGGAIGARLAIKGGERLVRAGVLLVTLALVTRLAWQMLAR